MRQFILSVFLAAIAFSGFGQARMKLSFSGSPSVNWMSSDNQIASKEKSILGYDFGLNADIYSTVNERYSFLTGIQISNIGGEISYRNSSPFQFSEVTLPAASKIKYLLRYVEVPLAVKLKTNSFHRTCYWGQFGVSTMINIGARGDSSDGQLNKATINDEINMFNLAMNIGIGFDYDLGGNTSVTTGLVFQNGLIDVTTDNAFNDKTIINSLKLKIGVNF